MGWRINIKESSRERAARIWQAHCRLAAVVLVSYRPRGSELQDLLQEVALRVHQGIDSLRDDGAAKAWIRTIAKNVARAEGRRRTIGDTAGSLDADDQEEPEAPQIPDFLSLREESRRVLQHALTLPESLREPLLLRAIEGLSQADIARSLGLTESAVEARLSRARSRLRELSGKPHVPKFRVVQTSSESSSDEVRPGTNSVKDRDRVRKSSERSG